MNALCAQTTRRLQHELPIPSFCSRAPFAVPFSTHFVPWMFDVSASEGPPMAMLVENRLVARSLNAGDRDLHSFSVPEHTSACRVSAEGRSGVAQSLGRLGGVVVHNEHKVLIQGILEVDEEPEGGGRRVALIERQEEQKSPWRRSQVRARRRKIDLERMRARVQCRRWGRYHCRRRRCGWTEEPWYAAATTSKSSEWRWKSIKARSDWRRWTWRIHCRDSEWG